MQTETTMSAALSRAGMNTTEFRLRQAAHDALAKHHRNVERALPTFKKLIDYSGKNELVDAALLFVLKELSADGQTTTVCAVGRQPNGDGRGQTSYGDHTAPAASSPRGGAGLGEHGSQSTVARPIREPSPQQRAADAAVAKRISVLDTFKIAGRAIGDWLIVAAKSEGAHMEFHGRVLLELAAEAERSVANIESWMTFRDVIKDEQKYQRCIQRASGVSNGA